MIVLKRLIEGASLNLNGFLFKRNIGEAPVTLEVTEEQALQYASFFEKDEPVKKIKEISDAK